MTGNQTGIAVERVAKYETSMVNGRQVQQVVGIEDAQENGHPKVVIVEMPMRGFWEKVANALNSPDYTISICDYDWRVTRIGERMNTSYDVQLLSNTPSPVDMRLYEAYMPDLKGYLKYYGEPATYAQAGFPVPGAGQPQQAAPVQQQAQAQQPAPSAMGNPQPQQTGAIPAAVQQSATTSYTQLN